MNRARPLRFALLASVTATLLAGGVLVIAQQNRNKPQGLISRLLKTGDNSSARAALQKEHPYRSPDMTKIPSDITRRRVDSSTWRHRAPGDTAVPRQTVLLTKRNPSTQFSQDFAPSQDQHPHWTFDEKLIYFDSDRKSETDPTATGNFNIFRMSSDGSGVTQITTGSGNKIEPSTSRDGSRLAYVSGGSINPVGAANPTTSGFNLFVLSFANGEVLSLTQINPSGFAFTDVRHPSFSPSSREVVFAGKTTTIPRYRLYTVNIDSKVILPVTTGSQANDDYSPAWSPDGSLIAYTSNAAAFTPGAGPISATGVAANDDIFVISSVPFRTDGTPIWKKVTSATFSNGAASNKNPAWSTTRVDPLGIVPNETDDRGDVTGSRALLAFASNRADTNNDEVPDAVVPTTDIYYLQVGIQPDPSSRGAFTIRTPESAGNPALKLRTSTPDTSIDGNEATSKFDPLYQSNEDYPAWPQYSSYYRIAFQSDRGSNLNIWASTIFDINAPTLLKYNIQANEIVQVSRNSAPNTSVREVSAGETVRVRARFSDYESGIYQQRSPDDTHAPAYVQFKAPDSAPQSLDGKEHKVYFVGPGALDNTNSAVRAPYEWDYQAIKPNQDNVEFREPGFISQTAQIVLGGGIPADWPGFNLYVPGTDDELAFSGHLNPPDNEFWLPLYDDGAFDAVDPAQRGHEPTGEVKGDGVFSGSWRTPVALPSDWIMDLIVYDNAVNPFDTNITTNWKIYDNVWGFSTKQFVSQGSLLYVNDYDCGQKFFTTHFGTATGLGGQFFTAWPTESWMTEIDPGLLPTNYQAPNVLGPLVNVLNPLGQVSYSDSFTNDGTSIPITQRYDQWRILCRGPLPESILNLYGARIETQPADVIGGGTGPRQQVVAERCIVWHTPYSGDLFVGPGTLVDVNVQNQLKAFVGRGGRILMTGQDIAWALSLGGGTQNAFLNSVMRVSYAADIVPGPTAPQIDMIRGSGIHPISTQTWYQEPITIHNYPAPAGAVPPWDPPAAGPIYLGSVPGTVRSWMALNQATFDRVTFLPALAQDVAGIDATYTAVAGSPAIMWSLDNATTRGKTVFSPFGWEGINPEFFSAGGTPPTIVLKNRRAELMHNALDYLRTGRIIGSVRDINGAQPLSRVFIRAIDRHNNQVAGTTLSQANGEYVINGLDPTGIYDIDAFSAGFITAHTQGTPFHGGYQSRLDMFLTPAQPGTISGVVTLADGVTPVAGVIVEATNPVTQDKYTAVTDSLGRYSISAPVITDPANPTSNAGYVVRIINLTELQFSSSIPPSYGGGEAGALPAVKVGPSENVTGINFKVKPLNGSISGRVTRRDNPAVGIGGALITATNGTLTFTATANADGTYTITGVEPGTYGVVATAVGFSASPSLSVTVGVNGNLTNVDFQLDTVPPGSISGLVQTSSGLAIAGATITLTDTAGNAILNDAGQAITATTGQEQTENGYRFNYRISGVPAGGTVLVKAAINGYLPNPTPAVSVVVPSNGEAKNINFTVNPLFQFSRQLSLVSAPYNYTDLVTSLFDNFTNGDLASGISLFVTWDTSLQRYVNPSPLTFQRGKGYFLESRNPAANLAVRKQGDPGDVTQTFEIPLKEGWNMIGTPFNFPLNLYGLKINDNGSIVDITAAQAGESPAIGGALWTFDNGAYQLAYTLDPWRGYWIRAFRSVTLVVPPTARQDRSAKADSRAPQFGNARGDGWSLDLIAKAGTILSAPSRIGITRSAVDGYDRFKLESPPAVGAETVTLTSGHSDWSEKNGKYSLDMRSASSAAQTWDFTVTSNVRNAPVTVQWPAVATVPGKVDLVLTDLDSKTVLDMRTRSSYTLPAMQDNAERHLRVEMRRATRQSLEVLGLAAVVNRSGTGGRAATSAAISYSVTADAETQVTIMQNGKRIRTLETGRHRAAGSADALWDLKDEKGQPVGSNQYTVEVRASDSKGRTRRQVVPLLITR